MPPTKWKGLVPAFFLVQALFNFSYVTELKSSRARSSEHSTGAKTKTTATAERLIDIFRKAQSTKRVHHYYYGKRYAYWFTPYRFQKEIRVLDIGRDAQLPLIWAEFLADPARIVRLHHQNTSTPDSSAGLEQQQNNNNNNYTLRVIAGHQAEAAVLEKVCKEGPYDIIVDNGSLDPRHLMASFTTLFTKTCLVDGGMYVLDTDRFASLDAQHNNINNSVVDNFQRMAHVLNRQELLCQPSGLLRGDVEKQQAVCSLEFGPNLIRVGRCTGEEKVAIAQTCAELRKQNVVAPEERIVNQRPKDSPSIKEAAESSPVPSLSSPPDGTNQTISIFYNMYIPVERTQHALRIIQEQFDTRKGSVLANATLYYTLIGNTNATIPDCTPCSPLRIEEQGGEILTLQAMYGYCRNNPSDRVVYLHDKGSHTVNEKNERLRRILTDAVFAKECAHMSPGGGCNVCGAKPIGFPFHTMTGNMFVAECAWVNKLLSPVSFQKAKEDLHLRVLHEPEFQDMRFFKKNRSWQLNRTSWVGTGRYAMEHWIMSHPASQPCGVYPHGLGYRRVQPNVTWTPQRQPISGNATLIAGSVGGAVPWFLLPGRLIEWKTLYAESPPSDSWIWNYYDSDPALAD